MMDTSENFLTKDEEKTLLKVARAALAERLKAQRAAEPEQIESTPVLLERHGAFVTLRNRGELRGCIGYTSNDVPLMRAVEENAINAATRDYRFPSVTAEELDDIKIEISALTPGDSPETPFKKVSDVSEIAIGRDGLYIERPPMRGGILLPQVPVEQGWDVGQFLAAVCRKAGYPERAWEQPGYHLYRFSAQVFSEEDFAEESH